MQLYFSEGGDLTDREVLVAGGGRLRHGRRRRCAQRLATDEDVARIEAEANSAKEAGIEGVPFFIFGNLLAVSGAQPPEHLAQAIEQAVERVRQAGRRRVARPNSIIVAGMPAAHACAADALLCADCCRQGRYDPRAVPVPQQEQTMINAKIGTTLVAFAIAGLATALTPSAAQAQPNQHMEIIHHPNYNKSFFMPFVPGIKIKSGKILWLAGTTSLPVYHDHPHRREDILKYLPPSLEAQTRRTMDGIKETLDAAGASFKDVVHIFVFRARPQMGDIGGRAR